MKLNPFLKKNFSKASNPKLNLQKNKKWLVTRFKDKRKKRIKY